MFLFGLFFLLLLLLLLLFLFLLFLFGFFLSFFVLFSFLFVFLFICFCCLLFFGFNRLFFNFRLFFLVLIIEFIRGDFSASIKDLQGKSADGSVDHEKLGDLELDLLGTAFNGFFWLNHLTSNIDDAFSGYTIHILNHLLSDGFVLEGHSLQSGKRFSEDNEGAVSLGSNVVDSSSD